MKILATRVRNRKVLYKTEFPLPHLDEDHTFFSSLNTIFVVFKPKQVVVHHKDGSTTTYTKEPS